MDEPALDELGFLGVGVEGDHGEIGGAGEDTFTGATGKVEFDAKGDRKDAEITIFKLKDGKVDGDNVSFTMTRYCAACLVVRMPPANLRPTGRPQARRSHRLPI